MKYTSFGLAVLSAALLVQCGGKSADPTADATLPTVLGAKNAVLFVSRIVTPVIPVRPTASMGVFVSTYLAQGAFIPVSGALNAIAMHLTLLSSSATATTDDTFALLQEFGSTLQVDVLDTLNRSTERATTLEQYVQTLRSIGLLAERKKTELEATIETVGTQRKEQQTVVRDIDREISAALKAEDYATAGAKQQPLTEAESKLAELESRENQAEDILDRFEQLLEVATLRLDAIEKNREILIAGLKVVDVPGIKNLNILEEDSEARTRNSPSIFEVEPL